MQAKIASFIYIEAPMGAYPGHYGTLIKLGFIVGTRLTNIKPSLSTGLSVLTCLYCCTMWFAYTCMCIVYDAFEETLNWTMFCIFCHFRLPGRRAHMQTRSSKYIPHTHIIATALLWFNQVWLIGMVKMTTCSICKLELRSKELHNTCIHLDALDTH